MSPVSRMHTINAGSTKSSYNWPVVGLLFFLTAVPGLPAVLILINLALGAPPDGSEHGFVDMRHFVTPLAVTIHGGSGILFFLCMPFQFSAAIRNKYRQYHRFAGGITILSAYTIALTAPWMHEIFSAESGLPRYAGLLVMSAGMVIAFSLAFNAIIRLDISKHRTWMMRGIAITLGPVTPLFLEIPVYLVFGSFENAAAEFARIEHSYGRWIGMAVNLVIVEYLLLRNRTVRVSTKLEMSQR